MFFVELVDHILGTLNGPGHQLRVKHDVKGINSEVKFRFLVASVNLDRVTHRLEGVKRKSDGQKNFQVRNGIGLARKTQ